MRSSTEGVQTQFLVGWMLPILVFQSSADAQVACDALTCKKSGVGLPRMCLV